MKHRGGWILLISFSLILLWGTYIQYHYMQKYDTMVEHYENKVNEYEVSEKILHKQLVMAYIKEIDNEVILFDEVEWINMPSERAAELGIKASDAPNGFLIYNEENSIAECNIADNCEIYILDWENLYEEKQITLDIFKQRGNLQIPYILTIEDGRVINISERYIP